MFLRHLTLYIDEWCRAPHRSVFDTLQRHVENRLMGEIMGRNQHKTYKLTSKSRILELLTPAAGFTSLFPLQVMSSGVRETRYLENEGL